jgi:CPA1 family monovalent cation:H+ antiporter
MHDNEMFLLGLMAAVVGLNALARVIQVPYPILLVIGGLVLGALPGIPDVQLDPDLVLIIFLPPLLYAGSFFASLRDLRADLRGISMLSIGLVLVTMCAVAVVSHALIDGLPWAAAFALGAIVAPTDPVAATAIMRRLGVPRRIVTIVEGESLINDGTALVAYRVAVAAAVGGSFSAWEAGVEFVLAASGGVAIGLAVGWLMAQVRKRLEDPPVEITMSLFTGYLAYLPADQVGASGVLAVVAAGIYLGWRAPELMSPPTRMQGFAVWEILTYLLNSALFILIGLQIGPILDGVENFGTTTLIGYAAIVSAVVIGARIVWAFTVPYLIRALDRRPSQVARRAGAAPRFLAAWSGMRGAVSLAAALALPLETDAGAPFPAREVLIFITFGVIFATLVIQGLTLPLLVRALPVEIDDAEEREEIAARIAAAKAALDRLDELGGEEWTRDETVERLRALYQYRKRRFAARAGKVEDDGYEDRSVAYQQLLHELLAAQRLALVRLRNDGVISSEVMRRVERDLDLEESRLEI